MKRLRSKISVFIGITLVSTLLSVAIVQSFPFMAIMGNWVADLRVANLTAPEPQHPEIIIAAITEDTLKQFPYRSPVDRGFLSDVIESLNKKGVKAIGIDLLFDQPTEPKKDQRLKQLLRTVDVPVVAAYADKQEDLNEQQVAYINDFVPQALRGYANLAKDSFDGTARKIYPGRNAEDGVFTKGMTGRLAEVLGATPPQTEVPISWRGRPEGKNRAFRIFPAHAIKVIPPAMLKDKIVLIGADLTLTDLHRTPFAVGLGQSKESLTPGVLVHAHGLAQLIDGKKSSYPGLISEIFMVFFFTLVGVGITFLAKSLGLRILLVSVFVTGLWASGFIAFQYLQVLLPLITPTIAVAIAMWAVEVYFGQQSRQEKRVIKGAFSQYMSASFVEELMKHPDRLKVGGEHREMSFLFTDIANFTSLSEVTPPEILTELLNAYIDKACEIVMSHGGLVDKIVGDAVVAIFNAPTEQLDHAERAVACALELDAFGEAFRIKQIERDIDFGITRIGVNTGTAVVGNFGGNSRFDYTAHGDAMNTAARLESLNKHLGTRTCVSEETVKQCPSVLFRPVGNIILKGKTEGIATFQPVTDEFSKSEQMTNYMVTYEKIKNEDQSSENDLKCLLAKYPDDALVKFHATRYANGEHGVTVTMKDK